MAGDWIPMRMDLPEDPAIIAVARALNLHEETVVGLFHRLWSWANQQTVDGIAPHVTPAWLDRYLRQEGFASAAQMAGWLECTEGRLVIPNFERWNGKSAKARLLATRRQHKKRGEPLSRSERDKNVTREEKRIEEKKDNTPLPPKGGEGAKKRTKKATPLQPAEGFEDFWKLYPRRDARPKAIAAWNHLAPDPTTRERIREALSRQRESDQWTRDGGRYIPLPASWLNGRRWEDEFAPNLFRGKNGPEPVGPSSRVRAEEGKYDDLPEFTPPPRPGG